MFQIFSNELQERKLVQIKAVAVVLAFVIIIFLLLLIIIISRIVIIIVIITTPAVLELASSQNQLYVIDEGSKPFWWNPSFWSRNIKDIMENFFSLTYLHCNHSRGIQSVHCPLASHLHRCSTLGPADRSVGDSGDSGASAVRGLLMEHTCIWNDSNEKSIFRLSVYHLIYYHVVMHL